MMRRWQRAAAIIATADCVYTASSHLRSSSRGPRLFDTRHRAAFTTPPKPASSSRLAGGPGSGGGWGRGSGGPLFRWEHICTVIDGISSSAFALRRPWPPCTHNTPTSRLRGQAGHSSPPSCLLTSEGSDVTMKWGTGALAL